MSKELKKRNKKIVELHEKGVSYRAIAKIYKIAHPTVIGVYNRDKDKYSNRSELSTVKGS